MLPCARSMANLTGHQTYHSLQDHVFALVLPFIILEVAISQSEGLFSPGSDTFDSEVLVVARLVYSDDRVANRACNACR